MRKNFIVSSAVCLVMLLSLMVVVSVSCKQRAAKHVHASHTKDTNYLSGVLYTDDVSRQILSDVPAIKPDSGTRILTAKVQGKVSFDSRSDAGIASRIAGRIERMYIRYNYQPVQKGQLILELYSPDLVAAQRELLLVHESGDNAMLLSQAKQRLLLLGMLPAQVEKVLKSGQPYYRLPVYSQASGYIVEKSVTSPAPGGGMNSAATQASAMGGMGGGAATATPVKNTSAQAPPLLLKEGQYINAGQTLFTVYSNSGLLANFAFPPVIAPYIAEGQRLVFHSTAGEGKTFTGKLALVQPVLEQGESFTQVRIYLPAGEWRPGQLLTGYLPVVANKGWWLPEASVWRTGNKNIVFRKQGDVFVPQPVSVGIALNGMVQVLDGIGDWEVAVQASYLVDSESLIQ
ncbi:efflux RND transporter periplasmic adaptor subunit [Filimonas effusa]|uniref:Efflux RND transporter periplasmic adaptor subunit n=1 Tax=Filimonas effusa TaxID=2508721 RepID=A0A4Q1D8I1_9BACT|nr:efflux RND transporter periplasmic adaptor subunit [Filimonas effusa]RXK85647.1 efflux RND transporter periplasmic adaptor subunit [Filimonas effusa]